MKRNPNKIEIFGFIAANPIKERKTVGASWYFYIKNSPEYNAYIAIKDDTILGDMSITEVDYTKLDELWGIIFGHYIHGGFTFSNFGSYIKKFNEVEFISDYPPREQARSRYIVFGWDYLHLKDTIEDYPKERIIEECKEAIGNMKKVIEFCKGRKLDEILQLETENK